MRGWLFLTCLLGLSAMAGSPVTAQDVAALPPCETNVGPDGQAIAEFVGLIYAPVEYDQVRAVGAPGSGVRINPYERNGLGILVQPEFVPRDAPPGPQPARNAAGEPEFRVEFIAGTEKVVHVCAVHVVAFDPARHDIEKLRRGDCTNQLVGGIPQLRMGHAQVWRTSADTVGYIIEPRTVVDAMTLDNDLVTTMGNTPGMALLGVAESQYGQTQINLCPVEVVADREGGVARPIDDRYLCKDPKGKPLRLAPGETATVRPLKADGTAFETTEHMVQAKGIAKSVGFDKAAHGPIVQAVAVASTSVVLLGYEANKQVAQVCEVVVE